MNSKKEVKQIVPLDVTPRLKKQNQQLILSPSPQIQQQPSHPNLPARTWSNVLNSTINRAYAKLNSLSATIEIIRLSIRASDGKYRSFMILDEQIFPLDLISGGDDWGKKKGQVNLKWLIEFQALYDKFYANVVYDQEALMAHVIKF